MGPAGTRTREALGIWMAKDGSWEEGKTGNVSGWRTRITAPSSGGKQKEKHPDGRPHGGGGPPQRVRRTPLRRATLAARSMGSSSAQGGTYDYSFKILLIGDSGVGKSSLLVSFISNLADDLAPTIGVDFKIKQLVVAEKRLKLTIWDTAGQEKFRTLTSSYYRGAQGIILVYDVTRRETFTNLSDVWANEIELYSTNPDCVKMLVGNKVDKESERMVTREEGISLAKEHGCLFLECSAKTRENIEKCFDELALKILEVPSLLQEGSAVMKRTSTLNQKQEYAASPAGSCCS